MQFFFIRCFVSFAIRCNILSLYSLTWKLPCMKLTLFSCWLLTSLLCHAQKSINEDYFSMAEDTLSGIGRQILEAEDFEDRKKSNQFFFNAFSEILLHEQSIDYPFKKITNAAFQVSDDKRVRTITWMLPLEDGFFKYFGFVQVRKQKDAPYQLHVLNDASEGINKPTQKTLQKETWYGAIYYALITTRHKNAVHYTLLGYDANSPTVQRKVIDYLNIDKNNNISFGAPIFVGEKKTQHRVLFHYAKDVSMSLRFDKKQNRIVFDHLVPQKPSLEGLYEFYGPDFSYDAYIWDKGKWVYQAAVDARNEGLNEGNKAKKPQRKEFFKP